MSTTTKNTSLAQSYFWVVLAYFIALVAAFASGYWLHQQGYHLLIVIGLADVVATIVVFGFSYYFDNSSFYDPYWSVIPIIIAGVMAYIGWDSGASQLRMIIMQLLIAFWGLRLTYNWLRGWQGLHHQDWRYVDLQKQHGKLYWLVSFSGIHLFPTVLVFMGCFALYPTFILPGNPFGFLDVIATVFTLGAILVELIADQQLHRFVKHKKKPGETLTTGIWKYSRHPNYFGETAFWWGLFLFVLAARPDQWWPVAGPLAMTLLFHFISIPMIEKRMFERRENYQAVVDRVPRWIPWFPKK